MVQIKVAVDAAVFTVKDDHLMLLLIKRKNLPFAGKYALPGGFIEEGESPEEAAIRELAEETSVKDIFLKQLKAYGDVKRDPRGRVISIAYLALINPVGDLFASSDALSAEWHDAMNLPDLAFDHDLIIADALKELRIEVQTTNIAGQIMAERFTLTQLQRLYENVLGKELDKRNFRKMIKEFDILKATKETYMEGAHRPALLYEFKNKKYSDLKEKVHIFLK